MSGFSHFLPELPNFARNHNRRSWSLPFPTFPEPLSLDTKTFDTQNPTTTKQDTIDKMMWDSNDRVVPDVHTEGSGDTYDMAYFLRTTGPPANRSPGYEAREDRTKRKKIMLPPMFRRKKDSLLEPELYTPPSIN
jgi:hypothetical protein